MLRGPIDPEDKNDPINLYREAHNKTLFELKEELTKAVTDRKAQALPLAIQIFNRIQDKAVKVIKLDDFAHQDPSTNGVNIDNIDDSLGKINVLLNDGSSPIISSLRST